MNVLSIPFKEYKNDLIQIFEQVAQLKKKYSLNYFTLWDRFDEDGKSNKIVITSDGNEEGSFTNTMTYEYLLGGK